jgi:hypothetical protein
MHITLHEKIIMLGFITNTLKASIKNKNCMARKNQYAFLKQIGKYTSDETNS